MLTKEIKTAKKQLRLAKNKEQEFKTKIDKGDDVKK